MKIYELVVDPEREEHIALHHVEVTEVEEVVFSSPFITRARQRVYRVIGQTDAGRYLTIIVGARGAGVYGLITARDADDSERRLYHRQHRG